MVRTDSSTKIGRKNEKKAAEFLEINGYKLLDLNYRKKYGEIDIIAVENDCLCFVEVKYRNVHGFAEPEAAVDKRKQLKIRKTAAEYIRENYTTQVKCRFDVIAIKGNEIRLFKDAF